jgi:uncharacterized membrane protein YjgN (DUF898 family)
LQQPNRQDTEVEQQQQPDHQQAHAGKVHHLSLALALPRSKTSLAPLVRHRLPLELYPSCCHSDTPMSDDTRPPPPNSALDAAPDSASPVVYGRSAGYQPQSDNPYQPFSPAWAAHQAANAPAVAYRPPEALAEPAQPQLLRFRFTGSSDEFFRIWIVNTLLTIVTLGIYNAWSKVRIRQYFYANTLLDGHAFEYLGDPISILKGNILVGILTLAYFGMQQVAPLYSFLVLLVAAPIFPWIIHKSARFLASHSAYRNIRFRFHGTLADAYKYYLLWPLTIPLSLGLMFPAVIHKQRQYLYNNAAFGGLRTQANLESKKFYNFYIMPILVGALVAFGVGLILAVLAGGLLVALSGRNGGLDGFSASTGGYLAGIIGFAASYFVYLLISLSTQSYTAISVMNYCLANIAIPGKISIRSDINVWELTKINVVNLLAMTFSLGLATPWAKIRASKYVFESLTIIMTGGFEEIAANNGQEAENALGEAATDAFDFNFAL